MFELIDYIDEQIHTCIPEVEQYGLCHLLSDDNGQYPATVEKEATGVFPDEKFEIITYHRLLAGNLDPREDASFGRKIKAQNNQRVRMVVFIDMDEDQSKIDDIINALPDSFDIDGYEFVNVSKNISLVRDRNAIWEDEYAEAYKDKYQMHWNIYAIEYDLQYIKCPVCVA